MKRLRLAGAIAIVVLFAALAARLVPPYVENWKLSQDMTAIVAREESARLGDGVLQSLVSQKGAERGLPVRPGDVRVDRRGGTLRLEARYQVVIDLPAYTVRLHLSAKGQ